MSAGSRAPNPWLAAAAVRMVQLPPPSRVPAPIVTEGGTEDSPVRGRNPGNPFEEEHVNLSARSELAVVIGETNTRPTVGSKGSRRAPAESLAQIESANDSASEDEDEEGEQPVHRRRKPKPVEDRTYRAPGRRRENLAFSILAWLKPIPMPTRGQMDSALEQPIGRDSMEKLKTGEQVEITLGQAMSHASWQGQDPVLWMVAAWVNGAFNVDAHLTNNGKKLDDVSGELDMDTLVALVSSRAGEPMELISGGGVDSKFIRSDTKMWVEEGGVQWMVDNVTLDHHLLAEANQKGVYHERKGNTWSKAAPSGDFFQEPWVSGHPCAPQGSDTALGTMAVWMALTLHWPSLEDQRGKEQVDTPPAKG
ncbi:hypothetical protein FN846DRAFT_912517 [Sphaerosporella brunnea]|uniref:Uncharacterized protein n=1 Tax=Sphaerosporella brunnea TaxID=1250544 RepID=A0A5J5EHA0_9PEZI|nr:hypothetical protein FN846DRAFT_912517 [Sphaerosporella brunnea]